MNDYDHGILRIPMKRGSFILNFILNYELSYYIIIKRASLCERSRWSLSQLSPACYAPRLHAPLLALTMPRDLQTPVYISTKRRVGDQKVEAGFPLVLCMENFHSLPRQLKARGNNHLRVTELHASETPETCEAGARFGIGGPTISHLNRHVSAQCLHPHGPCAMFLLTDRCRLSGSCTNCPSLENDLKSLATIERISGQYFRWQTKVGNQLNKRKINENDLKTLSFNDKDNIKGKMNSTMIDFLV
ncbi:hypothetical protein DVH24_008901 [Malus domestica]|uniref:Uncharacterized protein n=1 Tax=Malus domestica TaxID=3750 RepID=A0A498JNE0_MALDO|nr:hypothetical protein DVH24_008901 [Malus domestica]